MGLCSFGCCSGISSLMWYSDCIYICSYGSSSAGLLISLRCVVVSLILAYSCLPFQPSRRTENGSL